MKRLFLVPVFCFISMILCSCNQENNSKNDEIEIVSTDPIEQYHGQPIMVLDKRLSDIDSIVVVFYKDPYGTDSLRYSRFYTQFSTTDSNHIQGITSSINYDSQRFEKTKPCRNEGKIWCFSKGRIFQTIYYSTLQPGCHFVYIIINGQFYYSPMQRELENLLATLKPMADDVIKDEQQ